MSKQLANLRPTPATQAANVLKAWVVRDEDAFHREIGQTFECCAAEATGFEDENLELLRAVAGSLRERPMNSEYEPMVHLCIDLLIHLAGHSGTDWAACGAEMRA